jgi:peroxiredoxin-like protein
MNQPYSVEAEWTKGREGSVQAPPVKSLEFSAPSEFGGRDGLWTPEHLLLAAVTSCYIASFSAVAELNHFQFRGLRVSAEGALEKAPGGLRFLTIVLKPRLTIVDPAKQEQALVLLEKAKKICIISRSLSAEVVMDAVIACCDASRVPELVP